jgi:hypothetical protein
MSRFGRDFRRGMGGGGFGATAPQGGTGPVASSIPIQPANSVDEADIFDPMGNGMDVIFYTTSVAGLSPGSPNAISSIQIDSGIDFYWIATTYLANVSGDAPEQSLLIVPLVTLLINDTGSRKNLQNVATPLPMIAGTGDLPYRLIKPRLFQASSTINFTWASYDGTNTYANIYLSLHGFTKPAGTN